MGGIECEKVMVQSCLLRHYFTWSHRSNIPPNKSVEKHCHDRYNHRDHLYYLQNTYEALIK